MDQYIADTLGGRAAAAHVADRRHGVELLVNDSALGAAEAAGAWLVTSYHRQAVRDPGNLRVIARAADGTIEAVDDPRRRFYVGVQWHAERAPTALPPHGGPDDPLNGGLFRRFVAACAQA